MESPAFSPSSVVRGSESHKMIDLSGNPVLRIYYTSRVSISCLSLIYSACAKSWAVPFSGVGRGRKHNGRAAILGGEAYELRYEGGLD